MLHQRMMYRFDADERLLNEPHTPGAPGEDPGSGFYNRLSLAVSVIGNVFLGSVFLGSLLLLPLWLERLFFLS